MKIPENVPANLENLFHPNIFSSSVSWPGEPCLVCESEARKPADPSLGGRHRSEGAASGGRTWPTAARGLRQEAEKWTLGGQL